MNKRVFIVFFLIGVSLLGCSNKGLSGGKPPKMLVEIGKESYEMILGTYCWKNICVDTVGPIELLKGKEPIKVEPGEAISLVMDYEPKPNEIYLTQINGLEETKIEVKDSHFIAPTQQGIYYYAYGAWWLDEKEENLSHGDAFYSFAIEVN